MSRSTEIINNRENYINTVIDKLHVDSEHMKKIREMKKTLQSTEKEKISKEISTVIDNYENKMTHLKDQVYINYYIVFILVKS